MTKEQLKDAVRSISYEIAHIVHALRYFERYCGSTAEPALPRLAIEAFLLHYRNIRDFLSGQPLKDDMSARDFCPTWQLPVWPDHIGDPRSHQDSRYSERELINKRISHLSYFREELRNELSWDKRWPLDAMLATVRDEFSSFVTSLPAEQRAWFQDCVNALSSAGGVALGAAGSVTRSS